MDCFPFFRWNQVFEELNRNRNSPSRIALTLDNLFRYIDTNDNCIVKDIASVKRLLPRVPDAEVRELFRAVGHLPNRKAFIVRVLLNRHNKRKRTFPDVDLGDMRPKVPRTVTCERHPHLTGLPRDVPKNLQELRQNLLDIQNPRGLPKDVRGIDPNLLNNPSSSQNLRNNPHVPSVNRHVKCNNGYVQDFNRPSTSRDALIAEADTTINDRIKWLQRVEKKDGEYFHYYTRNYE